MYKDTSILTFKFLLTEAGFESEVTSITPEQMKRVLTDAGCFDPQLLDTFEKAYTAVHDLYNDLKGEKSG